MFFWSVFLFAPAAVAFFGEKYRRYVTFYFGLLLFCFVFFVFYQSSVFGDGKNIDDDIYVFSIHPALVSYYKLDGVTCDGDSCGVGIKSVFSPTEFSMCSVSHRKSNGVDMLAVRARFAVCKIYLAPLPGRNNMILRVGADSLVGDLIFTFFIFVFFIWSIVLNNNGRRD
ncbi:hypothetical protein [Rheinheimera pleomorphica]|uniref:hypothetical protein n=1 Tax=Rheinheimera pleomorphica TaxID=2703963 RepID=UPI00142220C7|nr:hypothetical protein [Rheinheimera pleomorphica]